MMAPSRGRLCALLLALLLPHAARSQEASAPAAAGNVISMRAGEEDAAAEPVPKKRSAGVTRHVDRKHYDAARGNNFEAATRSATCKEFLRTYLPQEADFGDAKFYLKL